MSTEATMDNPAFARRFFAGKQPVTIADLQPGQRFWGVEPETGVITSYLAASMPWLSQDGRYHVVSAIHTDSDVEMYISDDDTALEAFCVTPDA